MPSPRPYLLALLLALAPLGHAADAPPAAADPVLEKRVNKLAEELRCLVCQNQTIADSHADLAIDLKNQVREKLKAGMSEEDVKRYMVDRYGDFVLYRPPMKATTVLLWVGPFVLLIGGVLVLFMKLKARSAKVAKAAALSEAEHERALALLETDRREGGA
jgi:cytochrome c-type biogenesis protein CcmH